jgi:hypothetical protein
MRVHFFCLRPTGRALPVVTQWPTGLEFSIVARLDATFARLGELPEFKETIHKQKKKPNLQDIKEREYTDGIAPSF